MKVEVVYALPEQQWLATLDLPPGSTVAEAISQSGILEQFPELADADQPLGIFGRPCGRDHVLCAGDRIEFYRPLQVDPKEARRRRARKKGG